MAIGILMGCFLTAGWNLYCIGRNYVVAGQEYQTLREENNRYQKEEKEIQTDGMSLAALRECKKKNPDFIGWLKFETVDIDYPIVQAENNEDYLHTTFSGEKNPAGTIFAEAQNQGDFQDQNMILYGHNMKDQSMFGKLKKYKEKDFYEANRIFFLDTEQGRYQYQIFACYESSKSTPYQIQFPQDGDFEAYLNTIKKDSLYPVDTEVDGDDLILTLSTCTQNEKKKMLVHAVQLEKTEYRKK